MHADADDYTRPTPGNSDEPHVALSERFAIVPEALLYDPAIPAAAVRVYGVLARHGSDPTNCYPSHRRIAALIGQKPSAVPGWIRQLQQAGWIEVVARAGADGSQTSNGYVVHARGHHRAPPAVEQGAPPSHQQGAPLATTAPNESQENESQVSNEIVAAADAAATQSATVDQLCDRLADHVQAQRGIRPAISEGWRRDMRLLLERGPRGRERPSPLTPSNVEITMGIVFTQLAEPGGDGFCWADQVRSPEALRRHWDKMAHAYRREHQRGESNAQRAMRRVATRPAAGPLPNLLALPTGAARS